MPPSLTPSLPISSDHVEHHPLLQFHLAPKDPNLLEDTHPHWRVPPLVDHYQCLPLQLEYPHQEPMNYWHLPPEPEHWWMTTLPERDTTTPGTHTIMIDIPHTGADIPSTHMIDILHITHTEDTPTTPHTGKCWSEPEDSESKRPCNNDRMQLTPFFREHKFFMTARFSVSHQNNTPPLKVSKL